VWYTAIGNATGTGARPRLQNGWCGCKNRRGGFDSRAFPFWAAVWYGGFYMAHHRHTQGCFRFLRWMLAGAAFLPVAAGAQPAELVIRQASVLTMDGARPTAQAVAIRDKRIVYVGSDAGVQAFVGRNTRVLSGSPEREWTVVPGLADAHAHLVGLGQSLLAIDVRGLASVERVVDAVRKAASDSPNKSRFLVGRGWDQNRFSPPNFPDGAARKLLDEASGQHPVWLRRIDGHAGWANSAALRLAGIDRKTPDVPGGRILRDASGEPTGIFIDNAMELVENSLPKPTGPDVEAAILRGAAHVTARGLTAVHEMGISQEAVAAYKRLSEQGRLPLRVYAFLDDPVPQKLAQVPHSLAYEAELSRLSEQLDRPGETGLFSFRGFKLFADGALGSRGAALSDPYADDPGNHGLLVTPPDHIEAMARFALLHGYQLTTHALGDRAVEEVLAAYRRAGVGLHRNVRFRVEHAQVVGSAALGAGGFAALGVIASMQPQHARSDGPWAPVRLGPERMKRAYAWRLLLDSGVHVAFGSDFPVEEADPRLALEAAIWKTTPPGPDKRPPADALTVGEAVRLFTADAAYAAFAEDRLGKIAVGYGADLTVLEGKLSLDEKEAPPLDLPMRKVVLTVVDGAIVFEQQKQTARRQDAPGPNRSSGKRSK